ncbi:MAG: right-handed parallel beta-helix repeat-containing protein, partial [Lentisphaeria bacterium]|nr:right-handed parallel beta-helix repeat-containing protein [Lentisphaeria bacterium]
TNNHVYQIGDGGNAWAAIQIHPGCGGNCTHDNVISHNLVHDTPRQGIRFDGVRNIVEYNRVHHTNQEQSDTGAIGMGSRDIHERGSIVRYNYVHDTGGYNMLKPGVWEYPHYCWGIYLDDYTSGVHVYGNICVRTYLGGVDVHGGQDNIIENNIIVDGKVSQLQLQSIDSLTSGRTKGHPDTSMWLMTGTVIRRNIFSYDASSARFMRGRKYEQVLAECDRNLFWPGEGTIRMQVKPVKGESEWEAWQKMGYDRNSVIADPLFVAPGKDDFRLREESPAFALGFKPIPVEKIGLYASDERASWPVPYDCWRETHLTHPGGLSDRHLSDRARRQTRGVTPVLTALPVPKAPTLDGVISAGEYLGAPVPVRELSMGDGHGKLPAELRVGYDAGHLYVAVASTVSNAAKLTRSGGVWGRDDGAEICLQLEGKKQPVFVIQGFPSGTFESVGDAGVSASQANALEKATRYAARIQGNKWCGEWAIPWRELGVASGVPSQIRFNVGLLKGAEKQWVAWVSTGAAPWKLDRAGTLRPARK